MNRIEGAKRWLGEGARGDQKGAIERLKGDRVEQLTGSFQ
jgi:hypothetical protein